jgi:hypothetical protein
MTRLQQKPILHGRDHATGGVDPIPGIGGLSFDTYPQAGNWLYVETDDSTGAGGSPSGYGIELSDYTSGEGGIGIAALGGGDVEIKATAGGGINIHTTGDFTAGPLTQPSGGKTVLIGDGTKILNRDGSGAAVIGSTSLDLYVRVEDTQVIVYKDGDDDTVGTPLLVIDATGTPSYHILSGASWVADL